MDSACERSLRDLPRPVTQALVAAVAIAVVLLAPSPGPSAPPPVPGVPDTWSQRSADAARVALGRPGTVSFVVLDDTGGEVAALNPDNRVPSASTIKVLILVAYLRQPSVADRELRNGERMALDRMITASSNEDATELLRQVGWKAMRDLAQESGLDGGFTPDTKSWGLSEITARALATFFHKLPGLIPERHREFAVALFGRIIPAQQWGMVTATPDSWAWHVKGGWIDSAVNQIGAFSRGREQFTVAITIEGAPGTGAQVSISPKESPAVQTLALVTAALFGEGDLPGAPAGRCDSAQSVASSTPPPRWAQGTDCSDGAQVL